MKDSDIDYSDIPPLDESFFTRPVIKHDEPGEALAHLRRTRERNMRAVAHAIAQQELEGLKVSEETKADLYRAAREEIDPEEVIRNIYRRLGKEPPPPAR